VHHASTLTALAAVMALGIATGAMLAEATVLVPYWRSLPADGFLAWYRANASRLFDFFGPLEIASCVLTATAAALYRVRRREGHALLATAALLAVAVLVAYPLYFQTVNASFEEGSIPLDRVAAELGRWAAWHWLRTAVGAAAFVAALLAVCRAEPTRAAICTSHSD
jgi:hypothetical protein